LPIDTGIRPPYGVSRVFDPNLELPYTLQWNVSVERSLGPSQSFEVSYVGAAGRRLLQMNQMDLGAINPRFRSIRLTSNAASSDYRALQLGFQRRLSKGLQALASYTWAHALDDDSMSSTGLVARRGNAAFDVRQVFTAAATYELPSPARTGLVKALLGNW